VIDGHTAVRARGSGFDRLTVFDVKGCQIGVGRLDAAGIIAQQVDAVYAQVRARAGPAREVDHRPAALTGRRL
jgi:hypothetical protein